ncbi:NAD(P)-dependent alcohol dehydrogenase [Isosphaeraceae bacterium EP7]
MRRVLFVPEGEAFGLKIIDFPSPELKAGEVRIRVRATSLNYRDLIALRNMAGRKVAGIVPLSDGAGEVVEIGEGVSRVGVGQKVAGCFFQGWVDGPFQMAYHKADLGGTIDGMLAEEVILNEQGIVRIPDSLSFEEAACLPCAGLTAWTALTSRGGLKPGATVLVLGTGGVSMFALQFATALGASVIVTSSSDEKLERARSLGASHTINYKTTPDWDAEVWRHTEKSGVDHVIEVGGPGTLEKSINSLKAGGQIALIGVLTGFGATTASLFPLMARNARIDGIYVGPRVDFEWMVAHLVETDAKPIIDRVFDFEQAAEAFQYMESGQHFGKVVIRI